MIVTERPAMKTLEKISKTFEHSQKYIFSNDEMTLYERVSVRPLVGWLVGWYVGWSVTLSLFGLLGVTNAVYTALFFYFLFSFLRRK